MTNQLHKSIAGILLLGLLLNLRVCNHFDMKQTSMHLFQDQGYETTNLQSLDSLKNKSSGAKDSLTSALSGDHNDRKNDKDKKKAEVKIVVNFKDL